MLPGVGGLQVRELTVGVADRFLIAVRQNSGPGAAKHSRTVLGQIMGLATREGAISHNPVREVSTISSDTKEARAFTLDEVRLLRAGLRADQRAVERDLPDFFDFRLGAGLRIGETSAVTEPALDLIAALVEVRATVVRSKEHGLTLQKRPKTKSGWRTLHLPAWLVVIRQNREVVANEWGLIFPSQFGKLRDRSNTNADLREALDPLGFSWATSHTFRKTTATLLGDGGLIVRGIADQLGHKRVSIAQDMYFRRRPASVKAARALEVIDTNGDEK